MQSPLAGEIQKSQYSQSFSKLMANAMKAAKKPYRIPIILSRTKPISSQLNPCVLKISQMENNNSELPKINKKRRKIQIHQSLDFDHFSTPIKLQNDQQNKSTKKYKQKRSIYRIRTQSQNKYHQIDLSESFSISPMKGQKKNVKINNIKSKNQNKNQTSPISKNITFKNFKNQWALQPWDWDF